MINYKELKKLLFIFVYLCISVVVYSQAEIGFVIECRTDSLESSFSYSNKYIKLVRSDTLLHDSVNIFSDDFEIKYSKSSFFIKPRLGLCLKDTFYLQVYLYNKKGKPDFIKTEKFYNVGGVGFVLGNICEDTTTIEQILLQDSVHFFYYKSNKDFVVSSYVITIVSSESDIVQQQHYGPVFNQEQKN